MSATPWILGGVLVAGVGYVYWRNRQAALAPGPGEGDDGTEGAKDLACAGLQAASLGLIPAGACKAGIGILGGVVDKIADANDRQAKHAAEETRRDAINKTLNGAVRLPLENNTVATGGTVQEFQNGCQPFYDAPGWSKCAPGTLDMWASAIDKTFGWFGRYGTNDNDLKSYAAFPTREKLAQAKSEMIDKKLFGTGSARPAGPDPLTRGPFVEKLPPDERGYRADDLSGSQYWIVKGRKVTCPAGQAPAMWDAAGNFINDQRGGPDYIPPCAAGGVSSFVPSSGPPPAQQSEGVRTDVTCGPNGTAPAGYTWVEAKGGVAGHWERVRAGQSPSPGPCSPNYKPPRNVLTQHAGALAVANGRLAQVLHED